MTLVGLQRHNADHAAREGFGQGRQPDVVAAPPDWNEHALHTPRFGAQGNFRARQRAKAKSKGQQEFKFLNPVSKQIEPKLMFFEKVGDLLVACGSYKPA